MLVFAVKGVWEWARGGRWVGQRNSPGALDIWEWGRSNTTWINQIRTQRRISHGSVKIYKIKRVDFSVKDKPKNISRKYRRLYNLWVEENFLTKIRNSEAR